MKRCSFAVFSWFLLVLGSAATAQGEHGQDKPDAKPGIAWETSFDGALAKAKKENKPILIAFIMDGEPANDEVVQQHYTDAEVVKLSSQMVCLLGNIGSHGTDACAKFGGVTCEQHQDVEKKARAAYLKTDVVRAPQHVFCDKNGVELFRKVYLIAKQELRKAMAVAIAGASPAMAVDEATAERTRVDKLLKDADSHNAEVRDAAFSALATADDARALPALLDKARSGNDETSRCTAIKALGQKGNHAAIKPLLGFVGDKSTRVALFAVIALDQIRLPDPVPELLAQLKKEKDTRLRGRELCAVARCLPESVEVQKVCLAALQVTSAQVQESALLSIYALKPDPKISAAVKPLLDAKKESTRALAAWILGRQQDPALVSVLQKIADADKSPDVRVLAAKAVTYCKGGPVSNYESLYHSFHWDDDL